MGQPPPRIANLDLESTVNSGQVFLWEKLGTAWYGIHGDCVVKFSTRQHDRVPEFETFPEKNNIGETLFRLDDDSSSMLVEIAKDPLMNRLITLYPGLRLMRQDPVQCILSFVCASNTNIPMIKRMLGMLAKKYGQKMIIEGDKEFNTFPSVQKIHNASEAELRNCGLGYRAKAIKAAAAAITEGLLDMEYLRKADYDRAKTELLKVYGIGPKIADCIMLFSLEKLDAFPIDIWIARALASHYSWMSGNKLSEKLTCYQYSEISKSARSYFGRYAGYAQQFLYYHMRQDAGKKW